MIKKIWRYFHSSGLFLNPFFKPLVLVWRKLYNYCLWNKPLYIKYWFFLYTIPNDECLRMFLILDGVFEKWTSDLFQSIITPWCVFVDVGANIGYFTVMASKLWAEVVAFEPVSQFSHILKKNIKENLCENVITYEIGVWAEEWRFDIYIDEKNPWWTSLIKRSRSINHKKETIIIKQLDNIINNKIDILKIDVEWFEYEVLLWAKKILSQDSLKIIIEFAPEHDEVNIINNRKKPEQIINILLQYWFTINVISEEDSSLTHIVDYDDFLIQYWEWWLYNLYAIK